MAENTTYTLTRYDSEMGGLTVGKIVFPADSITAADYVELDIGAKPSYVSFQNVTDRIGIEHWIGDTDNTCLKSAANGTRTLETTNGGITLTTRGFRVTQNATLAVIAASKTIRFHCVY